MAACSCFWRVSRSEIRLQASLHRILDFSPLVPSDTRPPNHRDDLPLELAFLDGAEGSAVLGAGAVIAEEEGFVVGEGEGVRDVGVVPGCAVVNVALDHGAVVDDEAGAVGDFDGVAGLGDDASDVGPAVLLEDNDVVCDVAVLEAVVEHEVAGADPGLHVVVRHGFDAEDDAEEDVQHEDHGGEAEEEALDFPDLSLALLPGLLRGLRILSRRHFLRFNVFCAGSGGISLRFPCALF